MSKHIARATQCAHPWRAVIRTAVALAGALAAMAPLLFVAITQDSPEAATGAAAGALAVAGAITRVLALPAVEAFLLRFAPWLAAAARGEDEPDEPSAPEHREPIPGTTLDLGATEYLPHGE